MKLSSTIQIPDSSLKDIRFDVYIAASGYEMRAVHALQFLPSKDIPVKVAFGFTDRSTTQREDNDRIFERAGFRHVLAAGDSGDKVQTVISEILKTTGSTLRVVVDYTSMTRTWYAAIIQMILGAQEKNQIECYFCYSPAEFSEPPRDVSPNAVAAPIPGFCGLDLPDKPSAVIVGLGYEKERALGLLEYIDPALSFAFYTDPPLDARYLEAVRRNNADLLAALPSDRIFAYPLADLQQTGNLLLSLYSGLRKDYRVILAPLGTKPFCLLCLLLAGNFRDVDVWRVTAGTNTPPQERRPLGGLLVLKTVFNKT